MNDHGLEQLVHFPTRERSTLNSILTSLPSQYQDINYPDKLCNHDVIAGTLKVTIPPIKKPRRKVYYYKTCDYGFIRKSEFRFAKEKYFNGHLDSHSVQQIFS